MSKNARPETQTFSQTCKHAVTSLFTSILQVSLALLLPSCKQIVALLLALMKIRAYGPKALVNLRGVSTILLLPCVVDFVTILLQQNVRNGNATSLIKLITPHNLLTDLGSPQTYTNRLCEKQRLYRNWFCKERIANNDHSCFQRPI